MNSFTETAEHSRARERFLIAEEEGHSSYWRRDKSPIEIRELTKLLQGIRKVVANIGRNTGTVVWEGMYSKSDSIVVDPTLIAGSYPVPAAQADIAIGAAVRGAFQKIEWTDHVREMAQRSYSLTPIIAYKLELYLEMAEKIYADIVSNRTVMGFYTEASRAWELKKATEQFLRPPTFSELLHIWWEMAADREQDAFRHVYQDRNVVEMVGSTSIGQYYTEPLSLLNSIVERLIVDCAERKSVTERCEYRLELYMSIFPDLLESVKFWPADRKDPFLLPDEFTEDMATEDKEKDGIKATLLSHAEEIEHNLKKNHVDFTEDLKSIVANFNEVARVEGNDFVMPSKNALDKNLLYKLRAVLQTVAQRNVACNRGLSSGKVDRRRLYRASTTGAIFHMKKTHFALNNNVVLLVDCTGSMAEPHKWERIEVIYQTLFKAIVGFNPNARIFAYSERSNTCRITEIYRQGRFYSVTPHGKTASGEAIIATVLSIKDRRLRPFIIHITDGASNWGCGVNEAIKYCNKQNVSLLTIGLKCDVISKTALIEEYGELIKFVNEVDQLPAMFKLLLSSSRYH